MKKHIIVPVLFLVGLCAFGQSQPRLRIVNKTGYTVWYVYVSQTASTSWGEDKLGSEVLMNGEYLDITLPYPLDVTNRYDIRLEDSDKDTYTKMNALITPNASIEFTISDLD
jgi:hypothetical protein